MLIYNKNLAQINSISIDAVLLKGSDGALEILI